MELFNRILFIFLKFFILNALNIFFVRFFGVDKPVNLFKKEWIISVDKIRGK